MPDLSASSPVAELHGVGPSRSRALQDVGVRSLADLLMHLPFRYEDRRQVCCLAEVREPGRHLIQGRVVDLQRVRIRRRNLSLVRGWVEDESGRLPVLWFNQPYVKQQIDSAREYSLYGEFRRRGAGLELLNPAYRDIAEDRERERIVPVYAAIGGIGGAMLGRLIRQTLERCSVIDWVDPVPEDLLQRYALPRIGWALSQLHQPPIEADVESLNRRASAAHARLSYGEFLELQLELSFLRGFETRQSKGHVYRLDDRLREILLEVLPFRLTGAQRRVLREISDDLVRPFPMLRLLQGDVGSGKTIIAVMALVMALESGLQGAFMAPTELLAEQHFRSLTGLLGNRYRLELLTSSVADRERIREETANGSVQLVVGTHALIQRDVSFARLGLAVVDEQHRFGVSQRRVLQEKGHLPDLLVMTATPIPRSLALTVYGDLSLSIIDELPPGRQPIKTRLVDASGRRKLYRWLGRELAQGSQAYIVFPLIEDSARLPSESIENLGEEIRRELCDVESAVLHGRIESRERESIMERFRRGEIGALIATTVIEVGVDVPNANIMIIESAERFGLSQLHQLRGRVGRGTVASTCVVVHGSLGPDARRRLEVFADTDDGFRIAEADLEIRGPGDLLGTRQSGAPWFRLADIIRDRQWLERAREDAWELAERAESRLAEDAYLAAIRDRARSRYEAFGGG